MLQGYCGKKSLLIEMNFLKVSFPAPETYFVIPPEWDITDLQVRHGALYYKGKATLLIPHDFHSTKQDLELITPKDMDYEDCRSFLGE
jgi:hypothetical protein